MTHYLYKCPTTCITTGKTSTSILCVRLDTKVLQDPRNYLKSIHRVTNRRLFDATQTLKHQNVIGIVLRTIIQSTPFFVTN